MPEHPSIVKLAKDKYRAKPHMNHVTGETVRWESLSAPLRDRLAEEMRKDYAAVLKDLEQPSEAMRSVLGRYVIMSKGAAPRAVLSLAAVEAMLRARAREIGVEIE